MGCGFMGGKKKNDKKKKGSKSGNPAKRAAENAGKLWHDGNDLEGGGAFFKR